jgi:hypothetical protein
VAETPQSKKKKKKKKKKLVAKCYTGTWNWAGFMERRQRKGDMRYGTWSVSNHCRVGSLKTVARKSGKCKLDLMTVKQVTASQQIIWEWEMGMIIINQG